MILIQLMILSVVCAALANKNDYISGDYEVTKTSSISNKFANSYSRGFISKSASPWQYFNLTTNTSECGDVPNNAIQCEIGQNLAVLTCYCLTLDYSQLRSELGNCFYRCGKFNTQDPAKNVLCRCS